MKFNNTNVYSSLGVKLIKDKDLWRAMILSIDIKSEQKVEIHWDPMIFPANNSHLIPLELIKLMRVKPGDVKYR